MRSRRRSGFTLFQLLVLIALFLLLLGLLLPAVRKVREAAARAQSQNNLKQLALACHNYYDANQSLPPGCDANNFSASTYLLPYVEQDNLFKTINMKLPMDARGNDAPRKALVKVFLSPNDPRMRVNDYGPTNYLFNAGSETALEKNNGLFFKNSKIRFPDITDGLSNTALIGETLKGDGQTKAVDVRRQHVAYKAEALKGLTDKSGVQDFKEGKHIAGNRCASWMDGRFLQGTYTATRQLNDARPDVDCGGAGGLSALRSFSEGVHIALADGSVRSVSVSVKFATWKLLHSRADGEALPDF